jgi:putative SOS response-associated peptidase YedK
VDQPVRQNHTECIAATLLRSIRAATIPTHVRPLRQFPARGSHRAHLLHGEPAAELRTDLELAAIAGRTSGRRHPEKGERHLDLLKWGLLPYWTKEPIKAKRPINARAETVATSGMFRRAFEARRCIVPADVFYESQAVDGGKQPYAIARQMDQPMAFAGLWEGFRCADGTVTRTFAIVTTDANPDVAALHDWMPVILEPVDWLAWVGEVEADPAALLHSSEEGTLRTWPVSKRVNAPRNNDAALLEPIAP